MSKSINLEQIQKKMNLEDKEKMLREITLFDYSRNQQYKNYLHPHLVSWLDS